MCIDLARNVVYSKYVLGIASAQMLKEGEVDMRRFISIFAAIVILLSTSSVYANVPATGATKEMKVMLYLKPDVTVELNGIRQIFKNVNGQTVYPLIYNGSAYLPIRAVSALMNEPIEWDSGSKTVFIGKTLSYPNKSSAPIPTRAAVSAEGDAAEHSGLTPSLVTGHMKPDVLVMYDFVIQSFRDVNGKTVYPINYNGSIYLPIRAISNLMNKPVTWEGAVKKICIGDGEEDQEDQEEQETEEAISAACLLLKDIFEREESLYYEATAKITTLKNESTTEEKQIIAASASENYLSAQALTIEVKGVDQTAFTDEEKAASFKLMAFAESNEYYILVLENIAYLAAQDMDYSMLADTFLYFAMDAQTKMKEARKLIID